MNYIIENSNIILMDELTSKMKNISIKEPDNILLQIIDYDFNKLRDLFINNEENIYIEPEPIHEHYFTNENCKIIYDYLSYNQIGYSLLKKKVLESHVIKRFNIVISDNDIQTYVDYYLDSLTIN